MPHIGRILHHACFYQIKQGCDGKWYAVFQDSIDAEDAAFAFKGCRLVCFGGYDNAYEL